MPAICTPEMFKQLDEMGCTIRFATVEGEPQASLRDAITGVGLGKAAGYSYQDAAIKVIEQYKDRPATVKDADNLRETTKTQAEKIEQLEAELAKLKPAETRKRRRAASQTAKADATDAPDTGDPPGTPSGAD